jgi:hypothetical protein
MASFILEDNSIAEKKALIQKISNLLKITTCNSSQNECKNLLDDIENTKNECNKLFRPPPGNPDYDYEKGAFIRDSACSHLTMLQKEIANIKGGKGKKSKGKRSKRNKSKRNKSKKNKSKRNKSKSKRKKTLRR